MRYKISQFNIPDYHTKRQEINNWCYANVGDFLIDWQYVKYTWRFRFKKHYVLFLLRWS